MNLFSKLWADDAGAVVTLEYLILCTFLALPLIVGVSAFAAALNAEFVELARSIQTFSQAYAASGYSACVAQKQGSAATDDVSQISYSLTAPTSTANISVIACP